MLNNEPTLTYLASGEPRIQTHAAVQPQHLPSSLHSVASILWRELLVWESAQPFKIELSPHQRILPCLVCSQGNTHKLLLCLHNSALQTGRGHKEALRLLAAWPDTKVEPKVAKPCLTFIDVFQLKPEPTQTKPNVYGGTSGASYLTSR